MPINYKIRSLRRLFGEANFLRSLQLAAPGKSPKTNRVATQLAASSSKDVSDENKRSKPKPGGGVPRAFFSGQPPRSMRNKAVGAQLFSVHLIEKQKMKVYYGAMRDDQFKRYVEKAKKKRSNVDAALMRLLELRLDTFLYRTGFVKTPMQGRQWIFHNRILVNDSRVNIKSFQVTPGDIVSIRDDHIPSAYQAAAECAEYRTMFGIGPSWILGTTDPAGMLPWMEIDRRGLSAALVRYPTDAEMRAMTRATLFPYVRDANMNPNAAMRAYR